MKLTALLLIAGITIMHAADTYSQTTSLSVRANNQTVESVLEQIEEQSEFSFFYNNRHVNTRRQVSIDAAEENVFTILEKLFDGTNIQYEVLDKNIILSARNEKRNIPSGPALTALQQSRKVVNGVVLDEYGEPIIGANVTEIGTVNGTITDVDGKFTLTVSSGATLNISYLGYTPQKVEIGSNSHYTVHLAEDVQVISDVVVTALGLKREEKALGYSVQKIDGDAVTTVKGVDMATSLTGKIAGLTVLNNPNFYSSPTILLRGESPLVVIDGVPFENTSLGDISSGDIESISVLKGATASALYGSKGDAGAIMITTKRGTKEGLRVSANSNTMFNLGYLAMPEAQTSYSTGSGGEYKKGDEYVWGDKMDIGIMAEQYNPYTYEWEMMPLVSKGKNNYKNFLQNAFVTNNNVNVAYKGKDGSVRSSLTHIYNKGQYPNNKNNKINFSVAGDMKLGKFSLDASINFKTDFSPQTLGTGYGYSSYVYNMVVWTGTDFDIREFKNYWKEGRENVEQNWHFPQDYNNPYFIANEVRNSRYNNLTNAQFNVNYEVTDWLKATLRLGSDIKNQRIEVKEAMSTRGEFYGYYRITNQKEISTIGDFLLLADKQLGDFRIGGLLGTGISFEEYNYQTANTSGGLLIPGFYSLKSSKNSPSSSSNVQKKQINSMYGKVDLAWRNGIYLEVTGRNDWSSTLDESERSFFYPSVSGSVIVSEFLPLPEWLSFWKVRGSWTMAKKPAGIYAINKVYTMTVNALDELTSLSYPRTIRDITLQPSKTRSLEFGTNINFFQNRLRTDFTYYTKLYYDRQISAEISAASGFNYSLLNTNEEHIKKGVEITLSGDIIKTREWDWTATFNWSRDRLLYHKIDPIYSEDKPWIKKGERVDAFTAYDWQRDSRGNIVHVNGMPQLMDYSSRVGFSRADWVWGFAHNVRYKDFTLAVSFDGRVGGKGYNRTEQALWNAGTHKDSDNRWRYDQVVNKLNNYIGPGVKVVEGSVKYNSYGEIIEDTRVFAANDVPVSYESYTKTYQPWNGSIRTQNIQDLTFIKLRELSVGYTLPKSISEKIKMHNLHVSFVGQNLWMWSKEFKYSDPDAVYDGYAETLNSPSIRYVGFNVKFEL
ncbi:MAG: SusC/RagA family TonB-linked outer membrane protein [Tannerellaceae bacterium]|nr:SusC/RagA family TonB-linked outer membrane protein [Tannerellaceae bacterium]